MKFDYNDINLIPKKCVVESRSKCDTSVQFGPHRFNLPVVPANMSSVIDMELATRLATNGYFYILHRFYTDEKIYEFVKLMNDSNTIASISVGVKDKDKDLIAGLFNMGCNLDYVTIDIAHGHANSVKLMIEEIRYYFPKIFIIAGNVSTTEAVADLQHWGANAIKVGIAPGCFAAGTRILMSNGIYKNIEDIEPGEFIINKDGKSAKVKNAFSTGYRDVVKYRTNTGIGFTTCTADHKHFIGDLSTNNCIESTGYAKVLDKMSKTVPKQSKYKWKEIENCNKNNSVLLLPKNIDFKLKKEFSIPLYKKDINYVTLKNNYDLGYIFGTFLGDGNAKIDLRKSGSVNSAYITWSFGKHEVEIVNKLNNALFNIFNKEGVVKEKKNMLIVKFYDKPFTEFISQFSKRTDKHLPENLLIDDKKYLQGIFDGLIDSDGNINNDRLRFDNTSKQLIELFNVLSYILYNHFPNNNERIASSGFDDCNIENCSQAYRTTLLQRPEYRMTNDYQVVKILEETDDIIDHVETFDLEIDDETHSFIANNVIVHNSACTTAFMTGFGSRNCQGSTVYECAQRANIPIIADGGIVYPADIAKAVVLGATMVMCGSLVSGCTDSPGKLKFINNEYVKEYWGSASEHESGKSNRIEGTMKLVPYKNKTVLEQMHYLKECLQSAISYGGGNTLEALSYVQWK